MGYVEFTYIVVKCGIINPNVDGFLDVSSSVVLLPPYYLEVVMVAIKFTLKDNKEDGSIPFLNTIVKPEADGTLSITVYR